MEGRKEKVWCKGNQLSNLLTFYKGNRRGMEFKEKFAELYFRDFSYALIGEAIE